MEILARKDNAGSIQELTQYVNEVKNMNIAKSKELVESHVNLAKSIKDKQSNFDFKKCLSLEHDIVLSCTIKDVVAALEVKMVKQYRIETILRLLCLLSVTQNGLKPEFFDHLRRVFVMCYGYPEVATLINL